MPIYLRDVMSFFVAFEKGLIQNAPPGVMDSRIRDVQKLLKNFEIYSNCKYELLGLDFSEGLSLEQVGAHLDVPTPHAVWSLVLNYGKRASILINTMMRPGDDTPLVNTCYRRFLAIKEAYHIVIRDEFLRLGLGHPDANSPEQLTTQAEALAFLPFSIVDFDSTEYPDSVKVENSAELLAFLTLYPLDEVAADRERFRGVTGRADLQDPETLITSTLDFARYRMVPQRYIDLLFKWHRFDHFYELYRQLRDGYVIQ